MLLGLNCEKMLITKAKTSVLLRQFQKSNGIQLGPVESIILKILLIFGVPVRIEREGKSPPLGS